MISNIEHEVNVREVYCRNLMLESRTLELYDVIQQINIHFHFFSTSRRHTSLVVNTIPWNNLPVKLPKLYANLRILNIHRMVWYPVSAFFRAWSESIIRNLNKTRRINDNVSWPTLIYATKCNKVGCKLCCHYCCMEKRNFLLFL